MENYRCPLCNAECDSREALDEHAAVHHSGYTKNTIDALLSAAALGVSVSDVKAESVSGLTIFKCPQCDKLFYTYESAESCCAPRFCRKCNRELPKKSGYTLCSHCRYEQDKVDAQIMTADEYKADPENVLIYDPGMENYAEEMDELIEHYDNPEDVPEYMWGTIPETVELSLENALEDFLEHASTEDREVEYSDLVGLDELRAAVDAFNENNRTNVYYPDKKVWIKTSQE